MTDSTPTVQNIPIADITIEYELLTRCEFDLGLIQRYASQLLEGAQLPPVTVFVDRDRTYLADGFHRLRAYHVLDRTHIPCRVYAGSRRDALCYAASANAAHGKPRSRADLAYNYDRAKRFGLVEPGDVVGVCKVLRCTIDWLHQAETLRPVVVVS